MLLDQLERAMMAIGDTVLMVGGGYKNFDQFDVSEENMTNEVVVSYRAPAEQAPIETRKTLNSMTKQVICDLAVERFGVDLNIRTEKKTLITDFLTAQTEE